MKPLTCTCGSTHLRQADFASVEDSKFFLKSEKGLLWKKPLTPEIWVCQECLKISFRVKTEDASEVKYFN